MSKRLAGVFIALSLLAGGTALAVDLTDLIGVVGGGILVSAISGPANDFINTITFNQKIGVTETTKVVPIVSIGSGTAIGAAQVAGPKSAVDRTKAVAQLETTFQGRLRIKILVPMDSENPLQGIRRVQGVGVSAVIDFRL
ncbi:MAG: hypothetical protein GX449_04055 [Synergistaceae bacterium]|nr:hypothetical protein [Synergistaceae bacterium]